MLAYNIAREIAYLVGWKQDGVWHNFWVAPDGREFKEEDGFDPAKVFLTFDMIHGAEGILRATTLQWTHYVRNLSQIVGCTDLPTMWADFFPILHATAIQKAEAILRTLDRWSDDVPNKADDYPGS